jgi:hypothetical protein
MKWEDVTSAKSILRVVLRYCTSCHSTLCPITEHWIAIFVGLLEPRNRTTAKSSSKDRSCQHRLPESFWRTEKDTARLRGESWWTVVFETWLLVSFDHSVIRQKRVREMKDQKAGYHSNPVPPIPPTTKSRSSDAFLSNHWVIKADLHRSLQVVSRFNNR